MRNLLITTIIALALATVGCGKDGSPNGPEEQAPTTPTEAQVALADIRANMVWVPPSPENPNPNGFFISKFELTRGQWQALDNGAYYYVPWDQSPLRWNEANYHPEDRETRNYAATSITLEATEFLINHLNDVAGYDSLSGVVGCDSIFRLPTEAEWRYAANFGTAPGEEWYFGSDMTKMKYHAYYLENGNNVVHEVGGKNPNAFGLYDVYGNAAELVAPDPLEPAKILLEGYTSSRFATKALGGSYRTPLEEINTHVWVPFRHQDGDQRNEDLESTGVRLVMNSEAERSQRARFPGR